MSDEAVIQPHRRRWVRGLLLLVVLPLLVVLTVVLGVLAAALQSEPRVALVEEVAPQDVARALLLLRTHDPRQARPGAVSTALVLPRDIEVLIGHGARRWIRAASHVRLERGGAMLWVTSRAPRNPFGAWLNVELRLTETGGLPAIEHLRVGRLPVPAWLAERLIRLAAERTGLQAELALAADVVRTVRFRSEHLLITYAWQGDSASRLFAGLVPPDELLRLKAYSDKLVELMRDEAAWEVPLVRVLPPVFVLARERSANGGDAAAENRAALTMLTLFANGRHPAGLVPAARAWPQPRPIRLLLAGRQDFPLHFLISASLATESTSPLAKAIGIYKEVRDSQGGSGFSFNDMAANRAGTRLGERLVQDAAAMQQRLAAPLAESDLLPPVQDLPEFMPEAEFVRRYGGVGAPPYNALMEEIERRVLALPLLR